MPHSTIEFPFEEIVFRFAHDHAKNNWDETESFLFLVDSLGNVISTEFRPRDESNRRHANEEQANEQGSNGTLFYDPFDWPEYAWLAWNNIDRDAMERIIGEAFDESAFRSASGVILPFPTNWSVMF